MSAASDLDTASPALGEAVRLRTADGVEIAAVWHQGSGAARAVVVVAAAMGVRQDFYAAFARWLAARGVAVLTFDYRGIGDSAPRRMRGYRADLFDWARRDAAAALASAAERQPGVPVHWFGHSLGGQIFGLIPGHEQVASMITVGTGSGYWRWHPPRLRIPALLLWYLLAPVAIALAGYFPGQRFGVIGNIPAGAMWGWRRWCLHPLYLGGEGEPLRAELAAVTQPVAALLFRDDEMMTEESLHRLFALYSSARVSFRVLAPSSFELATVGHFGFFRSRNGESLWPLVIDWIDRGELPDEIQQETEDGDR